MERTIMFTFTTEVVEEEDFSERRVHSLTLFLITYERSETNRASTILIWFTHDTWALMSTKNSSMLTMVGLSPSILEALLTPSRGHQGLHGRTQLFPC